MPNLDIYSTHFFLGQDLKRAREELGLTQEEFAAKCVDKNGYPLWGQAEQSRLETPKIKHFLDDKKRWAFKKLGIELNEI